MSNNVIKPPMLDFDSAPMPAEWVDKMAVYAKQGVAAEKSGGNMFSTRNGLLSFGGVAVPNNRMQVVIVGSMHERVWYSKQYSPDTPTSPACYAFSYDGEDMRPHADAETPVNPTCVGCPKDEWKSDPVRGRGKACKEQRRLALLPVSALASPEDIVRGTVGYLRVPVTSVKTYSEHVKHLGIRLLPVFAAVTEVEVKPDPKNQLIITFKLIAPITNGAILAALEARHLAELETMNFPYAKPAPAPAAAPTGGKF